jgi:hypothetical protein
MTRSCSPRPKRGPLDLPVAGRPVSAVSISQFAPRLRLLFSGDGSDSISGTGYRLQIAGRVRITTAPNEWGVDPEEEPDPAYLRPVAKKVARAVASDDGSLDVAFTDEDHLIIPAAVYEPWQLNGEEGSLIVSVAGGGLAVWKPSGRFPP